MSHNSPALIDWQNPLTDHPLWDGLVDGWMAVPGRKGWKTSTWRSLRNRYHGTLTNMDPATDWVADSPVGHWGSLDFSSDSDAYVSGPSSGLPVSAVTVVALINPYTYGGSSSGRILSKRNTSIQYEWILNPTFMQFQGANSTATVPLNHWSHVAASYNGTNVSHWVNGSFDTTAAAAMTIAEDTSADLRIGNLQIASRPFDGLIASVTIYAQVLSTSQVADLYEESRRGYPNMLRRRSTARYFVQPAAGGFSPWWASAARGKIIGSGVA